MPTHDINITASFVQDGDTLATGLTFPANGLKIKESGGGSDVLTLRLDEVLSNNRALNIQVSDGDRTVNVTGDAELEGTNTGDETTTTLGSKINGATEKTTPVDADMVGLMDSAAGNILKKLSWANIKATRFTTAGLAFARLTNPSAVRYPRINADNTVTALTIAQLYTDLAATGFVARTGSALAFDVNATYNSPTSPGSAVVTLDTSGAVAGVEVVAYFNHSTEPTWPAGITAVGTWYNSGLNVVRFVYIDASNISAVISNERPVSEWQIVRKTSATSRTGTTTLAADPTLVIPIAANQMVTIRGMIDLSAAAACDFKYRFTGPASPTAVRLKNIHGIDGGTAPSNTLVAGYNASDMVFAHTSTFNGSVNVNISIENGANAGTIAFEWAQNVSDASNATVRANSFLEYQYGA